jgi:hypothetical protein
MSCGTYIMFFANPKAYETEHQKKSIFKAWKWYFFFFEIAIVWELIVTGFFWIFLYKRYARKQINLTN